MTFRWMQAMNSITHVLFSRMALTKNYSSIYAHRLTLAVGISRMATWIAKKSLVTPTDALSLVFRYPNSCQIEQQYATPYPQQSFKFWKKPIVQCTYPTGWKYTRNLETWLRLDKFTESNISKFWFLNFNHINYHWKISKKFNRA